MSEQSTVKHTPGPWTVQFAIATNPVAVIYAGKRGDVAIVHRSSPTQQFVGIETKEAQANARLIAAAPEMLSALKAALQEIREHCNDYHHITKASTVIRIEAAISAAEPLAGAEKGKG